VNAYFKKGNKMKKVFVCLAAALAITASAYFIAQQAGSNSVTAQASCNTSDCE
jgi:hypothetical protein